MGIIAKYPKRTPKPTADPGDKPVYTVGEVAVLLGYSRWTVIKLFENEPDIYIRKHPETMHKRRRRIIRIPRAVFLRVKARFLA